MADKGWELGAHDVEVKKNKQTQRDKRITFMLELLTEGFEIVQLTEYQFRINGRLDIYPTWAKWHDIKTNRRGSFRGINVKLFVRGQFEAFSKEKEHGSNQR